MAIACTNSWRGFETKMRVLNVSWYACAESTVDLGRSSSIEPCTTSRPIDLCFGSYVGQNALHVAYHLLHVLNRLFSAFARSVGQLRYDRVTRSQRRNALVGAARNNDSSSESARYSRDTREGTAFRGGDGHARRRS